MEILRGQGADINWRDNSICPTETEYKTMVIQKTGGLITLVIRLMQLYSDGDKDLTRLATLLALYYHIREDYCGLISEKVCAGFNLERNRSFMFSSGYCSIPKLRVFTKILLKGNSIFLWFMPLVIGSSDIKS